MILVSALENLTAGFPTIGFTGLYSNRGWVSVLVFRFMKFGTVHVPSVTAKKKIKIFADHCADKSLLL